MSPGLHLRVLPLLIVGCAHQFLVVPDSDWQNVPAPQRAAIDRQHEADMVSARAELKSATAGLAEAERAPGASVVPSGPAGAVAKPDPDADPWAMAIYDHDQARVAAGARVHDALEAWQRTRLTWRQRQLASASARLDMLVCDREFTRARAIDRSLPGTDHYDSAPLQAQFSSAQQRWHTAATAARQARIEFERVSTTLASAKEAYAQLMRNGPVHLALQLPMDTDERPRLELTTWSITRTDIGRRKGLRRLLEAAASAPPQLRKRELRLRPVPRTPATETPRASSAAPPGVSAPAAEAAPKVKSPASVEQARPTGATSSASPPPSAKPWDDFVDLAARPVATTRAASATPPRTVAAAPSPKPWDVIEPAPPPATTKPPAAAPIRAASVAPPTAKSWDLVEPAARPAAARPPIAAAPARSTVVAAPPTATSWDSVEPAPRPTKTARSVTPATTAEPSFRAPRVDGPASPKPWDFVEPAAAPVAIRPAAAARVATRARKPPATPPAPKPWDFVEPAVQPAAAMTPVSTLPVANAPAAAKPWDFVEPAARPAAAARSAPMHEP